MNSGTVAVDVRMKDASGIGTYIRHVLPRVAELLPETEFVAIDAGRDAPAHAFADTLDASLRRCPAPIYSVREQALLPPIARAARADAFWAPHYNAPLLFRGPLVVTVHDVFHLAMPEFVGGVHRRLYARLMFQGLRRRATAILCDSHFTADELMRLVGMPADRLHPIPLGVDAEWFAAPRVRTVADRPYVVFVGNVKPHKNLPRMLAAFDQLLPRVPHDLVIVGRREGFLTADRTVAAAAARMGDRVRFTGFVGKDQLVGLVAGAEALVLPSLYEGFGLPALEAMAAGTPVLASRAASLPEVCGDAAVYCDPRDARSIRSGLERLLDCAALRAELSERGRTRARTFTWDTCARSTGEVLAGALQLR